MIIKLGGLYLVNGEFLIRHEDKVDIINPVKLGHKGWRISIPHEDKVDVLSA